MPIWKPFMDWMAAWALAGLSKLTKPEDKETWCKRGREEERQKGQQVKTCLLSETRLKRWNGSDDPNEIQGKQKAERGCERDTHDGIKMKQ